MAATGGEIVVGPNGETKPEYVVADWAQLRRAQADPYGYRASPAAAPAVKKPWTQIKELYR
jgi:hypothetical protein